jgi:hypothetical protein
MSKPGKLELFEGNPISLNEWAESAHLARDSFVKNLTHLETTGPYSNFEWYYMFGNWEEFLEFLDEEKFKKYWPTKFKHAMYDAQVLNNGVFKWVN